MHVDGEGKFSMCFVLGVFGGGGGLGGVYLIWMLALGQWPVSIRF